MKGQEECFTRSVSGERVGRGVYWESTGGSSTPPVEGTTVLTRSDCSEECTLSVRWVVCGQEETKGTEQPGVVKKRAVYIL